IWPTAPFNPPIKPLILSPDSGISKTKRSSNVISPNGLLSSLWVWQHKDESNPFLFATENSSLHVLFEQRPNFNRFRYEALTILREHLHKRKGTVSRRSLPA